MDARELISTWHAEYRQPLHHYIQRRIRSSDVEDVLQTVWVKAYCAVERGYSVRSPLPWLYTLAYHACINRKFFPLMHELEDVEAPSSEEVCLPEEIPVTSYLERLQPSHREVLSLRYVSELTNKEIEERLGLSHDCVKTRIHRGIQSLRKKLATSRE
jgi:RNA polymerase sigma-70 factor (ECF subfamily)